MVGIHKISFLSRSLHFVGLDGLKILSRTQWTGSEVFPAGLLQMLGLWGESFPPLLGKNQVKNGNSSPPVR